MTTAVIIQARLGSKRFPRKVLAPLAGKPVLQHVIERARQIGPPVILAVPYYDHELDRVYTPIFCGSPDDVLDRYYRAARAYDIDIIMRITADCPLIDPELCRKVIALYQAGDCDYAAIGWPEGGFPKGYGCEVFSIHALAAARESDRRYDHEHVTPWIERNMRCKYLQNDKDESDQDFCVDYPEDIARLEKVLDARKQIA